MVWPTMPIVISTGLSQNDITYFDLLANPGVIQQKTDIFIHSRSRTVVPAGSSGLAMVGNVLSPLVMPRITPAERSINVQKIPNFSRNFVTVD